MNQVSWVTYRPQGTHGHPGGGEKFLIRTRDNWTFDLSVCNLLLFYHCIRCCNNVDFSLTSMVNLTL